MNTPTNFPAIPGIDTADGLARMMNRATLYEKVLRDFHGRFVEEMSQLQALLSAGDYEEAAHRVHSAKGLAGTIGAAQLQESARQLEAPLRDGGAPDAALIQAFASELQRVLDGIRQAFPA